MSAISIIHAPRDEALGEKIAAALSNAGHVTKRIFSETENDDSNLPQESDSAAIVLWTHAAAKLARLHQQAFDAMARGALIPVAVNGATPPGGFEALPPVDLSGWSGAADDPRFRFILEEIQLTHSRMKLQDGLVWAAPEEPVTPEEPTTEEVAPSFEGTAVDDDYYPEAVRTPADEMETLPPFLARRAPPVRFHARDVAVGGTIGLVLMAAATAILVPIVLPVPEAQQMVATPQAPEIVPDPSPTIPSNLASVNSTGASQDILTLPMVSVNDALPTDEMGELADSDTTVADDLAATDMSANQETTDGDAMETLVTAVSAESTGEATAVTPLPVTVTDGAFEGNYFKECVDCPDMAMIPTGRFLMGATDKSEGPLLEVAIDRRYALSSREVTFAQWDACVNDGGCKSYRAPDHGWGRDKHPVVSVSYEDAQAYTAWLSNKTGRNYRLPSEAEWEYAARAGTTSPFGFDGTLTIARANFNGQFPYGGKKETFRKRTVPVASFAPNAFGLFDMHGNAWEWTSDCWSPSHTGGAGDGSPRSNGDCNRRVLKGGAWNSGGWRLRSGHRIGKAKTVREFDNGFRVARDLG